MQYDRDDAGYDRLATLDIETTHYDATKGETVSVGLAVHDRDTPASEITYECHHRDGPEDEAATIIAALERVDELDADALVSYNGSDFDMGFLRDRLEILGHGPVAPALADPQTHIDVFADRKAVCDRTGEKWPKLEDCLATYSYPEPTTVWQGRPVDNTRFGEELGPAYLAAVADGDRERQARLTEVIEHYLTTDLEANLALYYADIGVGFEPARLGERKEF